MSPQAGRPHQRVPDGVDCQRRLLAAMLLRACQVAAGHGWLGVQPSSAKRRQARAEALTWLEGDGLAVAEVLGLDEGLRRWLKGVEHAEDV